MGFKTCTCGQPAVLSKKFCGRCGRSFPRSKAPFIILSVLLLIAVTACLGLRPSSGSIIGEWKDDFGFTYRFASNHSYDLKMYGMGQPVNGKWITSGSLLRMTNPVFPPMVSQFDVHGNHLRIYFGPQSYRDFTRVSY